MLNSQVKRLPKKTRNGALMREAAESSEELTTEESSKTAPVEGMKATIPGPLASYALMDSKAICLRRHISARS